MKLVRRWGLGFVAWAGVLGGLVGCAAPPVRPVASGQMPAMALYAQRIARQLHEDRAFQSILAGAHVTAPVATMAVVTPRGFVEKGGVAKRALPPAAAQAVIAHLIDENFGPFLPGMPDRPLIFVFSVEPPAAGTPLMREAAFRQQAIVLYQPNPVLVARVGSAVPLAAYIKELDGSLAVLFDAMPRQRGVTAALVMGVKPGMQSRAWMVKGANEISPALVARIKAVAEAVPAVSVHSGPIAFAIIFNVWGGGVPITDAAHPVPMPKAWWMGAPKGNFEVPDGAFARIWP